jgi:hypothetical protein
MSEKLGMTLVLVALAGCVAGGTADKARDLLDEAIKAHGGADRLNTYKASTAAVKGKLNVAGQTLSFTARFARELPDRMRNEITVEVMNTTIKEIQVLNRGKGWRSENGKTQEMTGEMLKEAREELHGDEVTGQLTPLKGGQYKLSLLGDLKVGDRESVGLRVARAGFRDIHLYFDKKTHLLAKAETRAKDLTAGGKEVTVETFYDDYRPVRGVQVPHRLTIKRDGMAFLTAEVTDVKLFEKLGDDSFGKP